MIEFKHKLILIASVIMMVAACAPAKRSGVQIDANSSSLRAQTPEERASDFEILVKTVKELYAPLQYKEKRFGFKINDLANKYRLKIKAARDDAEGFGVMASFLANFHDGHVSLDFPAGPAPSYNVPIFLTPVEDKALIAKIYDTTLTTSHGIEVGDEVIEIDGLPTFTYLPEILKYESVAQDLTARHRIYRALRRPFFMTDLRPKLPTVRLKIEKADGRILERSLVWSVEMNSNHIDRKFIGTTPVDNGFAQSAAEVIEANMSAWGTETPFFMSKESTQRFSIQRVKPSEAALKKHGLQDVSKTPDLFAAVYKYEGKNVLLIRQPTYTVNDAAARIAWFKAVIEEFGRTADVMVLDQTHNPGGSMSYAQDFISLFANEQTKGLVNFLNADRKWLDSLGRWAKDPNETVEARNVYALGYKLVEEAYDAGRKLTSYPIPIAGHHEYIRPADVVFNKPVLMLVDELSGSCGDIVPALMKESHLATLFGSQTMGLGGNVESVIVLPSSQIEMKLTRGFFVPFSPSGKYDFNKMIENNGVVPDIQYRTTVRDFRNGYLGYVEAFSKAAVALR